MSDTNQPTVDLPEWFLRIPDDGLLSCNDVALLFGYESGRRFVNAMKYLEFPTPDREWYPVYRNNPIVRYFWKKETVLQAYLNKTKES